MRHKLGRRGLIALTFCSTGIVSLAANLTVSPAVVTNDFSGRITLTVTGLPSPGQTVRIEKFCDLGTNGVVDVYDPLVQSFVVTDGVIPTIAGVTNLNVPGDNGATANGQITTQVSFPGLDSTFSVVEGSYLFRVSSPSSAFTPVVRNFQVRQRPTPQSVSGLVYDSSSGLGLSNVLVVVFDSGFDAVGGTCASSQGNYSLYLRPGSYSVWAFTSGYLGDQKVWSGIVIPGSSVAAADIPMTPGTFAVSGKLTDNASGTGLPGVPIIGYQSNNLYAATFTDANGNYSLQLSPDLWEIGYEQGRMPMLGYVATVEMPATNVLSDVAGFDVPVTKADALIYGTIRDNQTPSNFLSSVVVDAEDSGHVYRVAAMTYAADGRYSLGVVGGNWWIEPSSDSLATLGCFGTGTNWVVLSGAAARMDFVVRKATAHLIGRAVDDFGLAISGATVRATETSSAVVASANADQMGNFDLGVAAGTWKLGLDPQTAAQWYLVGHDLTRTIADGQTISALTYRVRYALGSGSGVVTNTQGIALQGVGVRGTGAIAGTNYTVYAVTDASGAYWTPLLPGQWTFSPECFGYNGLSFQGCECVAAALKTVGGGDNNVLPAFAAEPLARPTLTSPAFSSEAGFSFDASGPTNRTFQVLDSSNLSNWNSIFATNPGGSSFRFTTSNSPATPARAFRVLVQ